MREVEQQIHSHYYTRSLVVWNRLLEMIKECGLAGVAVEESEQLVFAVGKNNIRLVWMATYVYDHDDGCAYMIVSLQLEAEGHQPFMLDFSEGIGPDLNGNWGVTIIVPTPKEYEMELSDQKEILAKIEAAKGGDVPHLILRAQRSSNLPLNVRLVEDEWWLIARRMIEHFIGFNA